MRTTTVMYLNKSLPFVVRAFFEEWRKNCGNYQLCVLITCSATSISWAKLFIVRYLSRHSNTQFIRRRSSRIIRMTCVWSNCSRPFTHPLLLTNASFFSIESITKRLPPDWSNACVYFQKYTFSTCAQLNASARALASLTRKRKKLQVPHKLCQLKVLSVQPQIVKVCVYFALSTHKSQHRHEWGNHSVFASRSLDDHCVSYFCMCGILSGMRSVCQLKTQLWKWFDKKKIIKYLHSFDDVE